VGSPRRASTEIAHAVERALRAAALEGARLVVGLSGGVDSVVLLHALVQLAPRFELALAALHVHHGLSPHADEWADFCDRLCRDLGPPLRQVRVTIDRGSPLGIEAAARAARYAVFRQQQADAIVLAHHLDDQGETLLLQLMRGAGVRGLSGMPALRTLEPIHDLRLVRPLLEVTRAHIVAYAQQAGLAWIEDESNADPAVDRSFLRMRILPELVARYPGLRETLGRAASNLADAAQLADDLATSDARRASVGDSLEVSALAALAPVRARNLLRWFLERQGLPAPSRDQLEEALRQALTARGDARIQVKLGAAWLRRHRGHLYLEPVGRQRAGGWSCTWGGERELRLPSELGSLRFEPALGAGLSLARLRAENVVVRPRSGGERLRLVHDRPSRTLKNLLQEAGVPEWERNRLPLLFVGDALAWVPGVGQDCRFAAAAEEAAVMLHWNSSAPAQ
jgi:tRNA(Ile)-lysidine synthase